MSKCPDCKQPTITRISNSLSNPNRAYYACSQCPGRDGKGNKFLAWVDGDNSFKKRKLEESQEEEKEPLKTEGFLDKLQAIEGKVDQLLKHVEESRKRKEKEEAERNPYGSSTSSNPMDMGPDRKTWLAPPKFQKE